MPRTGGACKEIASEYSSYIEDGCTSRAVVVESVHGNYIPPNMGQKVRLAKYKAVHKISKWS
mgnify:CR=1 FL=1